MDDRQTQSTERWALVLGGSRGLGLATAIKLAGHGYNLIIVHRDRRSELPQIEEAFAAIRDQGVQCVPYNQDALNKDKRKEILSKIKSHLGGDGKISVLLHSIAKGSLKPMAVDGLSHEDIMITIDAMAVSLYDWTMALLELNMLAGDTRVFAFTSEGNNRVIPNYAAVSAAKAALEALVRAMAIELAPMGLRVNCLQAGVTETDSLAMIPGSERLKAVALKRNPQGRLTRPQDVANLLYLLTLEEAKWVSGAVIKVDGGESLN